MKSLFQQLRARMDGGEMVRRIETLCQIEQLQTSSSQRRSIEYICHLMREAGIPNIEIFHFPADGKTAFEDKRMPVAWEASVGKLTLFDKQHTVAADYRQHPFHLIKGSTATAPGGETLRIITASQFLAGEDPRNALVVLNRETPPRAAVLTPILDQGGRGIISDFLVGGYEHPDSLQWVNACTEGANWHVQCDDRDFIGFSVSSRMGNYIRQLAEADDLTARVECDGRRYAGDLPGATALIPGRCKEEIWLLAHTFEPLLDDNSNGVISGMEVAKAVMSQGTPEYSLRLIFAMELYGFAAFHANFKGKVCGACNLDSLPGNRDMCCRIIPPIASVPFHGVDIAREMAEEFREDLPLNWEKPEAFDDMFLSESATAVPTLWFMESKKSMSGSGPFSLMPLWHNSFQTSPGFLDPDVVADFAAFSAVWFCHTLNFKGEAKPLPEFKRNPVSSPWRTYAAQFVFERAEAEMPQDLVRIPRSERRPMPDGMMYGPMVNIISGINGKHDLAELFLRAEAERECTLSDADIRKYIDALNYLADWGYLRAVRRPELTEKELADTLGRLGVKKGDVLLVHSSVSACGYIQGGAKTLIRAVFDSVGAGGTALFPTFTRPYIALGGSLNKGWNYRPFDPSDPKQIWTGSVPQTLLQEFSDVSRSAHITHSWAGCGAKAAYCTASQLPEEPPATLNSPMGKAWELGGKILYLGCGLSATTFLHLLETVTDMPFLQHAVCRVKNPDGSQRTVMMDHHLPGHRDFYRKDAENSKFFRRAVAAGLQIAEIPCGMGKFQLIDIRELYEIGLRLLQEDPRILLCDDPGCPFCREF